MEDNAFPIDQFWPFFLNRLLQSHQLLTVESQIYDLARFEQLMMNNFSPIPPNTQHHLPWRQYGLCNRLQPYVVHFTSPAVIRLKNGSISFRFSSDSQMETRSIKFFTVNSCGTQVSSFFWYPVLCKWFKTVLWSMFSFVAMSRDEICRATSIFLRISSTFSTIGRPGQGWSLTSKSLFTYYVCDDEEVQRIGWLTFRRNHTKIYLYSQFI